jgi:hypothetical protein
LLDYQEKRVFLPGRQACIFKSEENIFILKTSYDTVYLLDPVAFGHS